MRVRPISLEALIEELADLAAARSGPPWLRVAVDGAPAARPGELADALVGPLRLRGRPVLRVSASDFLRPASLRLEHGRTDPHAYYDRWLDEQGLRREVLDRLAPENGSGEVLPSLWDAARDRATRAPYVTLPRGGVLLLDGDLLLGRLLPFDLTVHLWLSSSARTRGTDTEHRWTLPAFERYEAEVDPSSAADVVVRMDDHRRPALVESPRPH